MMDGRVRRRHAQRNREQSGSTDRSEVTVIPRLPNWRDSEWKGAKYPPDIIGATIVSFGAAPQEADIEGGGLIIDYMPKGATEAKRLALGFNELEMWVERPPRQ